VLWPVINPNSFCRIGWHAALASLEQQSRFSAPILVFSFLHLKKDFLDKFGLKVMYCIEVTLNFVLEVSPPPCRFEIQRFWDC
jgi:hypothetical protein